MNDEVMTITTKVIEENPNCLMYNLGRVLIPGGSADFPTLESAEKRSPLASKIFHVNGVIGVFLGSDFITITKDEGFDWGQINEGLAPVLEAFFESGEPALKGSAPAQHQEIGADTADPDVVARIKQVIEEKARPAVAQHGGDVEYRGFKDGIVYLEMKGSCNGCPSSTITLKNGIEQVLKVYCPEVASVEEL